MVLGESSRTTQVIDETLSPTWDELLVLPKLLIHGRREDIKEEPPVVMVEIFDQDKFNKCEFIGRAAGVPVVWLEEELQQYSPPRLQWFRIHRGEEEAGG